MCVVCVVCVVVCVLCCGVCCVWRVVDDQTHTHTTHTRHTPHFTHHSTPHHTEHPQHHTYYHTTDIHQPQADRHRQTRRQTDQLTLTFKSLQRNHIASTPCDAIAKTTAQRQGRLVVNMRPAICRKSFVQSALDIHGKTGVCGLNAKLRRFHSLCLHFGFSAFCFSPLFARPLVRLALWLLSRRNEAAVVYQHRGVTSISKSVGCWSVVVCLFVCLIVVLSGACCSGNRAKLATHVRVMHIS